MTTIAQLAQLISQSVSTIEKTCATNGTKVPDLDSLFTPDSEAFRFDPAVAEAVNIASAAASQLTAILQPPTVSLCQVAAGHYKSTALKALLQTNTVEILREAGPKGLHVDQIAKKNPIESKKLARLLRYLCMYHTFREIEPDVFTITRISSTLDTGKSVDDLLREPQAKHDGTFGFAALIEQIQDDIFKSAAVAVETLLDPATKFSEEPTDTPFNRAFNTDLTYWAWVKLPEQQYRLRRFNVAMQGIAAMQPDSVVLNGFDWKRLGKNDVIVDVGGGVGTVSLTIAKACPDVQLVVQDLGSILEQGNQIWNVQLPEAISSGRVKLQAHDFFTPQPVKNASVFLLKQILHDWSDAYCIKILNQLRAAATSSTKLLIIDSIVPYACHDPNLDSEDVIPGAAPHEAPPPLLSNYGQVNDIQYHSDLAMLFAHNSQERTFGHLRKLLEAGGWRIVKIYRPDAAFHLQTEAVLI